MGLAVGLGVGLGVAVWELPLFPPLGLLAELLLPLLPELPGLLEELLLPLLPELPGLLEELLLPLLPELLGLLEELLLPLLSELPGLLEELPLPLAAGIIRFAGGTALCTAASTFVFGRNAGVFFSCFIRSTFCIAVIHPSRNR